MALITCPECGGTVSDSALTCPHCGYQLSTGAIVDTTNNTTYVSQTHNGYDVLLVDYMKGKLFTAARIQEVIDCTYLQATNLLSNVPCYLYNDLSYSDALYIAQSLQYYGMRIALYDPNGVATYYAPSGYNRPLPSLINVLRKPLFSIMPPRRHEFVVRRQNVRPVQQSPVRNSRSHMSMPMPNQPKQSSFIGTGMNRNNEPTRSKMDNKHDGGMQKASNRTSRPNGAMNAGQKGHHDGGMSANQRDRSKGR